MTILTILKGGDRTMSEHFNTKEFVCKCGCGLQIPSKELIDRLEKLRHALGDNPIEIVSGCRCAKHDKNVGGTGTGMHTLGGASDIRCRKPDGTYYTALTICEQAEKVGFGGIAVITDTNAHVDIRDVMEYYDSQGNRLTHWYGDERTHNDFISTFKGKGETIVHNNVSRETIDITIKIDGIEYSGKVERI